MHGSELPKVGCSETRVTLVQTSRKGTTLPKKAPCMRGTNRDLKEGRPATPIEAQPVPLPMPLGNTDGGGFLMVSRKLARAAISRTRFWG